MYKLANRLFDNTKGGISKFIQKETQAIDSNNRNEEDNQADLGSETYRLDLNRFGLKNDRDYLADFIAPC